MRDLWDHELVNDSKDLREATRRLIIQKSVNLKKEMSKFPKNDKRYCKGCGDLYKNSEPPEMKESLMYRVVYRDGSKDEFT